MAPWRDGSAPCVVPARRRTAGGRHHGDITAPPLLEGWPTAASAPGKFRGGPSGLHVTQHRCPLPVPSGTCGPARHGGFNQRDVGQASRECPHIGTPSACPEPCGRVKLSPSPGLTAEACHVRWVFVSDFVSDVSLPLTPTAADRGAGPAWGPQSSGLGHGPLDGGARARSAQRDRRPWFFALMWGNLRGQVGAGPRRAPQQH